MTERTVTTQAELDQALADEQVTTITINSPAGVWLNIGPTGRTVVNVAANVTVDRVANGGRVEWVANGGSVGWVDNGGSVGRVDNGGSVGRVANGGRVEWVDNGGSVGRVDNGGRVGRVANGGSVGRVDNGGRVEWVDNGGSVGRVANGGSVGRVDNGGRVEKATGASAIMGVYGTATVHAGPFVAVHLYSATANVTGGHIIDLTKLDEMSGDEYCAAMGIDHERLQAELEHITEHPEEWDQGVWATKTQCGTACCLAGGAVLRAGIPLRWQPDGSATYTERGSMIEEEARRLLGLSYADAQKLFAARNSLGRLWWLASEVTRGAVKIPATVVVGDEDRADNDEDDY